MNFVASPLFQLLFMATRSTKELSFDWFELHSPFLNNNSQIAKFSGGDEMAVYSRTTMCYAQVSEESHRYAP